MLYRYETRKLLCSPALVGFSVVCLIVNFLLLLMLYGNGGYEKPEPVHEAPNVFEGYQVGGIAEGYIRKHNVTEKNAQNVKVLYGKLQPVIERKAADGDALSPAFGTATWYVHDTFYGWIFNALVAEGCLIALFAALLSVGYENVRGTEPIICSSKTGRGIMRAKLAASLASALALFAPLLGLTLILFFARYGARHDFAAAWGDNVSNGFNYAVGAYGKPFITWVSFTVGQYLYACIGAAVLLSVCFGLIGFCAGVFIRNVTVSCLAAAVACGLMYLGKSLFAIGSTVRGVWNMTPVWLWRGSAQWFTDGEADIVHARFETAGLMASLAVLAALRVASYIIYKRRELT